MVSHRTTLTDATVSRRRTARVHRVIASSRGQTPGCPRTLLSCATRVRRGFFAVPQNTEIQRGLAMTDPQIRLRASAAQAVGVRTRCWIALMRGRDQTDPLSMQVKETEAPAPSRLVGASKHSNQVSVSWPGQRLMQAAGDILLGRQRTEASCTYGRWPGRTRAPATVSPSPTTPTRTNATTNLLSTPSPRDGSPPNSTCKARPPSPPCRRAIRARFPT
jgi:hypothetical protein